MGHRKLDRVQQTTSGVGTGGLSFDGPVPARMRTFGDTMSNGDQCWVLIEHQTAAEWEISLATYSAGVITRTFATGSSSSTGSLVSFSVGLKTVSLVAPASAAPIVDGVGNMSVPGNVTAGGMIQSYGASPSVMLSRSDNGQGWTLYNGSSTGDQFGLGYLTGGVWAGSALVAGRDGSVHAAASLSVGTVPPGATTSKLFSSGDVTLLSQGGSIWWNGYYHSGAVHYAFNNACMAWLKCDDQNPWALAIAPKNTGGDGAIASYSFAFLVDQNGHFLSGWDTLRNIGDASHRFGTVFAQTGTINTSDQREKQDIRALGAAELRVAKELAALVRIFRWKASVAEKGDAARLHTGWIAQAVIVAFEAEGLDAFKYGCVGFDLVTKLETFTEQRTREKKRDVEDIERVVEIIDGQPVEVAKPVTRQEPVGVMMPIVNEQGQPMMVQPPTYTDANGNVVTPAPVPRVHFVPTMETYTYTGEREVPDIDPDTGEQRKRYNIRPDQIMAFILAGLGNRLAALDTP